MTNKKSDIIDDVLKSPTTSKGNPSTSKQNSQAVDSSTTTEKREGYENWNTIPDDNIFNPGDLYEDVLTDESIQEDVAQATIRNLLQPSELLKRK